MPAACLPGGGSRVAAVSPDGKDLSLVIETFGAKAPQKLAFKLAGGLAPANAPSSGGARPRSNSSGLPTCRSRDGAFALEVEPEAIYSLTTTDGQQKGAATIPPARPMPLPYKEDFESYAVGATPKYLSDFFGAFEVAPRERRRQVPQASHHAPRHRVVRRPRSGDDRRQPGLARL